MGSILTLRSTRLPPTAFLLLFAFAGTIWNLPEALAGGPYGSSRGGGSSSSDGNAWDSINSTQQKRRVERFDIISWIRANQKAVAEQNSKYGYGKGGAFGGARPDLNLSYFNDSIDVTRQQEGSTQIDKVGRDSIQRARLQFLFDDLFTAGSTTRSFNIDLGVEAFAAQQSGFAPPTDVVPIQTDRSFREYGGGLLIRPFGRSSQDTGLMVKGGYISQTLTGHYTSNTLLKATATGNYLGAEAKLYLLPFLGVNGEYLTVLESPVSGDLTGKWSTSRFRYGAFVEIWLLELGAYLLSEDSFFTQDGTVIKIKESGKAQGLTATLHF